MKRKLLVIDTETGGIDPHYNSILSLGAVVLKDGSIDGRFHTYVREPEVLVDQCQPLGSRPSVETHGLTIDFIKDVGVSPMQAVNMLTAFLMEHDMGGSVTLAGHNVAFDVGFLKRLYRLAGQDYTKRFSYRTLCTQTGALLLDQAGRIDLPGGLASLDALCAFFHIPTGRGEKHDALEDAALAAKVLVKMVGLLK